MTFRQIEAYTLQLINQYTIAGAAVALSYDNQIDYVGRIPALANDCMVYLATTVRPIEASFTPTDDQKEDLGNGWTKITLPDDFWRLTGKGFPRINSHGELEFNCEYHQITQKAFTFKTNLINGTTFTYYKYPTPITEDTDGEAAIDLAEDAAQAIPYYAAAKLVMADDSFIYASLYNEFEAKVARLSEPVRAERFITQDVYGGALSIDVY